MHAECVACIRVICKNANTGVYVGDCVLICCFTLLILCGQQIVVAPFKMFEILFLYVVGIKKKIFGLNK